MVIEILSVLLAVAVLGFVVWLILLIPMPEPFPKVIVAVAVLLTVLWVLRRGHWLP